MKIAANILMIAGLALAIVPVGLRPVQAQQQEAQIKIDGKWVRKVVFIQPAQKQGEVRDSGASLKTDPDLEATLEKADRYREEKQYGIASKLWQSVLERSGDALFSSDGQIYYSLAEQVERIIASLPVESGLASYRITADANAREIMAEAGDAYDERALKLVVRNYFLSSIGDDSALTLSAIYMDQFDFVGAYRMLEKITKNYPDPSVSLSEVESRMAICQAMMGEEKNARRHLQSARQQQGQNELLLNQVESSISQMLQRKNSLSTKAGFLMPLADRDRGGVMPALPRRYFSGKMKPVWQYYFAPKSTRLADINKIKPIFGEDVLSRAADSVSAKEKLMIEKWKRGKWRPTGDLLFYKDQVYFKTAIDLSVWDRSANNGDVLWRPLWQNRYELDDHTRTMVELRRRLNRGRLNIKQSAELPGDDHEVQLFADRIASQMSIQDGVLYTIEGPRVEDAPHQSTFNRNNIRFNAFSRRSRSNQLTAYEAESGKLLWTLPPIDNAASAPEVAATEEKAFENFDMVDINDGTEESPWLQTGGFMSTPVAYGGLIIVPVNHGGAISVYALDPKQDGKTVWKSYLCDESETGANPYSPVNLSIDGSDLFASCGLGVVFIVDPTTGLIRFAKRYERNGEMHFNSGRWGRSYPQMKFESWLTDTVIAYGRQMVCFASDAKQIEAHDRNTGELIWRGEVAALESKVDYLLGVKDGILYAAGPETILAFDLQREGLMLWGGTALFNGKVSYGRGMLTSDAIYIPVENQIIKFSLQGNKGKPIRLKTANVELGTEAPVGNLFSDGQKIWVQGANRVYALGPGKKQNSETED